MVVSPPRVVTHLIHRIDILSYPHDHLRNLSWAVWDAFEVVVYVVEVTHAAIEVLAKILTINHTSATAATNWKSLRTRLGIKLLQRSHQAQ